jgi:hypothetical protein
MDYHKYFLLIFILRINTYKLLNKKQFYFENLNNTPNYCANLIYFKNISL